MNPVCDIANERFNPIAAADDADEQKHLVLEGSNGTGSLPDEVQNHFCCWQTDQSGQTSKQHGQREDHSGWNSQYLNHHWLEHIADHCPLAPC